MTTTTLYSEITPAMEDRIRADIHRHLPAMSDREHVKIYTKGMSVFVYDHAQQISAVINYDRALDLYELTVARAGDPLRDYLHVYHDQIGELIFDREV